LAGGVTADQPRAMELAEDEVAVSPVGAGGNVEQLLEALRISIPLDLAWSAAPLVYAITIWPLLLAVAVNYSTSAWFAPAVA
jgi:hypothetical protein